MDPLLIEIPDQITTERLLLRIARPGDGTTIFPTIHRSLPQLKLWMPWAKDDSSQEDSELWCRRSAADFILRKHLGYLMFLHTGEHLGNVSADVKDWNVPKCEIGYWLATNFHGRGLMSEAVLALTKLLLEQLKFNRIEIQVDERNERSCRVAERCGFTLDGTLRNDLRASDGSLRNMRVYSKIQI